MKMVVASIIVLLCAVSLFPYYFSPFRFCTSLGLPSNVENSLGFCQYNGGSRCDSAEDSQLQKQFRELNVSDLHCASLLQTIMCAKCDQYSADLFDTGSSTRIVPRLCTSMTSVESNQSEAGASIDLCTKVWDTCGNVSIYNSPFDQAAQENTVFFPTKLTDNWQSKNDFCKAFGGSADDKAVCFNGEASLFSSNESQVPIQGICIEKIGNGSYVSMAAHPDGSDSIILTAQEGKLWLASVPKEGSIAILEIDETQPFLDISDQILFQTKLGLLSMAFHPNFTENGRFFVSYNCDKLQHSGCSGRCACNTNVNCDPANLVNDDGILPCQYHDVIAEFTANSTGPKHTRGRSANPSEVRRIFTMGLPSHNGHAGQILFDPDDGYLYYLIGDESRNEGPYRFSQNKKSALGKILRVDVNNLPSGKEDTDSKTLWGNYTIPQDNPYTQDSELMPEIWALGFLNPWRCSFDSERPSYFLCGDSGQALFEEVDIITKGGNYGWPIYEGPFLHNQSDLLVSNASKPIFPVMGYNDSEVASKTGAASMVGGFVYRSKTDPCLYGRYLYTDVYANTIWVGTENPENSRNFTTKRMPWSCAKDSPLQCNTIPGSNDAAIGYAFSFGEDNRKDVYLLSSSGVYRITHPNRCNFVCSEDKQSSPENQASQSSSSSTHSRKFIMLIHLIIYLLYSLGLR